MSGDNGILICEEIIEQKISLTTKELIGVGRKLSDSLNQSVNVLLIGDVTRELAQEAIRLGADKVYIRKDAGYDESHPDSYVSIIEKVYEQVNPSVIIMPHNDMGRDIAPRVAARQKFGITMDCIDLTVDVEKKSLLLNKPVYGGNAVAIWVSDINVGQVVTIRPRSVAPAVSDLSRNGEIVTVELTSNQSTIKSKLLETVKEKAEGIKLEDARVVVAGGSGIGGRDGFKLLEELAKVLGGTIGVTRVPCDEGWVPISMEIGQTGRIVNPDLYIAVGISGAPQHMAGCANSRYIVSINRDAQARIFQMSDFGIVADYREALPPLIEKCKELIT